MSIPPPIEVGMAPNMEKDAEMQAEVQGALFNMLSGGAPGKGSNRSGKPNTPVGTIAAPPVTAAAAAAVHKTENGSRHTPLNNHKAGQHSSGSSGGVSRSSSSDNDTVPEALSTRQDNTKAQLKNGKMMLALSADDGEEYHERLPSASLHPSGTLSSSSTPLLASPGRFFGSVASGAAGGAAGVADETHQLQMHPKALANKNYGKASSFNKVFGSNHSMEENGDETDCVSDSDKVAQDAAHELMRHNTALNSSSGASDEQAKIQFKSKFLVNGVKSTSTAAEEEDNDVNMSMNKTQTLTDFDLHDSIEYDLGSIRFHSKSKSIKFSLDPNEASGDCDVMPEMTAEDEFGYEAYSSGKKGQG